MARNFVRATPTVIGRPTSSPHPLAQPRGDLHRRARDPPHPAHVEERLVDRHPLDHGRHVVEDPEDLLARRRVGLEARRDDDHVRTQLPRLPSRHRGLDAEGLRLVARGQHDPPPDDDRTALQTRIVALLDRREERVEVRVEDVRLAHWTRTYVPVRPGRNTPPTCSENPETTDAPAERRGRPQRRVRRGQACMSTGGASPAFSSSSSTGCGFVNGSRSAARIAGTISTTAHQYV